MIEARPRETSPDPLALRVFLKAIELLGGLRKLTEFRGLTWLPSIARAAYAVVLREEYGRLEDEIAQQVGMARQSLRNMLRADPRLVLERVRAELESPERRERELKVHVAGGIAKLAYRLVKEGQEPALFVEFSWQLLEPIAEEIPWAYALLRAIRERGVGFPIPHGSALVEELGELELQGRRLAELAGLLRYPINNPASLLAQVKEALRG